MEISHTYWLGRAVPKTMSYVKMEELVKAMQHPQTGVPVKSQKLFLTTIPSAFTGEDLIEWLTNRLDIKDSDEATHLASIICKYGYFFHVTSNDVVSVKEDGELYRFQAPYFWISTNWNSGNIDFAVYLVKRTMRNKEKHGLDENENHMLEELKKKLSYQWDFIRMQADAQARTLKDRKKTEKTIIDSQEKAFWNLIRPIHQAESSSSILDEDIKQTFSYANMKQSKVQELLKAKIKNYHQALKNRVRTKSTQLLPSLCAYSEAYEYYEALIGNCLPSNPWITEDQTFWEVNAPIVDLPTQLRVKRWSFSFKDLLSDQTGVREFMKFCEMEFSAESLKFYLACQDIKKTPTSDLQNKVIQVFRDYLSPDCGTEVNVNESIRHRIMKRLETPSRDIFAEAEKHIFELMKKNSYSRFEQSEQYKDLLAKAIIPMPKKSTGDTSSDEYDSDEETSNINNNNAMNKNDGNKNNQKVLTSLTGAAIFGAVGNATALTAAVASLSSPTFNRIKARNSDASNKDNDNQNNTNNNNNNNFNDLIFEITNGKSQNETRRQSTNGLQNIALLKR